MGVESFEDRLKRLKSVDISKDCNAVARDSAPKPPPPPRAPSSAGPKREISDKAANLIAQTLKTFLGEH
ncbi:MAG: hypothetical protein LBH93_05570 [Chitinispirillales bacterium]|jgi:hypothetical protein|nr:hypothetical protein [Chitinispirillales bacterium]